ncbi:hypothetical protein ABPG73_005336 [Tetrahymena malaccensis]
MENLNQVPKIYCKKHNFAISYIKASSYDNIDNFFKCGLCVVKEENSSDCLFIEEILSSNGNQIYNYLPPLLDKKYFKEIEAALQNNIDPIQLLEEQFKDFQEQIAIKIQETKKLVISYALSQKVIDNDFLKTYEQISKIQELRQILTSKESTEVSTNQLMEFFKRQYEQKELNTILILDKLEKLKKYQSIHQLFDISQIAQDFNNKLDEISSKIEKYKKEDQIVIELNNLQSQYQFLKSFKQMNSKYSFSNYNVPSSNSLSSWQKQICQNNNQIQNLYDKYSFQNSYQSSQIIVQDNPSQNEINIKKKNDVKTGCIYFKYELNQKKKYIIRFKFNDEGGNYINLGLINSQNVENELAVTYQGKAFGCNGYTKYGGEIVDGEYFWKVKQDYIVEMIINIKEKQIQFLDCSQLLSKNQLRQQGLLDPDNSYYLAIDFGTLGFEFNTSIDIIYFQEVDSC